MIFLASLPNAEKTLYFSAVEESVIDDFIFEKILTEGYQRIGIKVKKRCYPMERALLSSNLGKTDGEMARIKGISEEYKNLMIVPVVVLTSGIMAFSVKDISVSSGWESLTSYRVVIQQGMKIVEINAKKYHWNYRSLTHTEQLFRTLVVDRYDVAVTDLLKGLASLRKLRLMAKGKQFEKVMLLKPPLFKVELYHYLHKKNRALISRITAALLEMENEGLIKTRKNQHSW